MTGFLLRLLSYVCLIFVLAASVTGETTAYYYDAENVSAVITIGTWESDSKECVHKECGTCENERNAVPDCEEDSEADFPEHATDSAPETQEVSEEEADVESNTDELPEETESDEEKDLEEMEEVPDEVRQQTIEDEE